MLLDTRMSSNRHLILLCLCAFIGLTNSLTLNHQRVGLMSHKFMRQGKKCQQQTALSFVPTDKACNTVSEVNIIDKDSKSHSKASPSSKVTTTTVDDYSYSALFLSSDSGNSGTRELIGEDAAAFDLSEQKLKSWGIFAGAVATVLSFIFYIWVYEGGPQWGNEFKSFMEGIAGGDSTLTITYMLGFFAVAHSGLASLRPAGEEIIGARAWRVLFALVSLPLALSCIVYFINHRYEGQILWDLRSEPWMHDFVWWSSLVSFFFLYPSTFNLLEVAAVDNPKLHLWETGITRITRHPQMVGQLIWCIAHTAYIGSSFMVATSTMLCLHHFFSVWNGDRRLRDKYGEKADLIRERTSIIPFAAILTGKQEIPSDYYLEFFRLPYVTIVIGSIIAYTAHPFMQAGSALLKW